jgi:hypothetical protein
MPFLFFGKKLPGASLSSAARPPTPRNIKQKTKQKAEQKKICDVRPAGSVLSDPKPRDVAHAVRVIAESTGRATQSYPIRWSDADVKSSWNLLEPVTRRFLNAAVKLELPLDHVLRGGKEDHADWLKRFSRIAAGATDTVIKAITHGAEIEAEWFIDSEIARRTREELEKPYTFRELEFDKRRGHIVDRKNRVLFPRVIEIDLFQDFVLFDPPGTIAWFTYDKSQWKHLPGWYEPQGGRKRKIATDSGSSSPPAIVHQPSNKTKL